MDVHSKDEYIWLRGRVFLSPFNSVPLSFCQSLSACLSLFVSAIQFLRVTLINLVTETSNFMLQRTIFRGTNSRKCHFLTKEKRNCKLPYQTYFYLSYFCDVFNIYLTFNAFFQPHFINSPFTSIYIYNGFKVRN